MKANGGVPVEQPCLVGTGDIFQLNDSGVQVRLQEDPVAVRHEILWQPHDRWQSCGGGGEGWTARRIHGRDLGLEHNGHGDNGSDGKDSQDSDNRGYNFGFEGLFGHGGCFLWPGLKVHWLVFKSQMSPLSASGLQ